MSRNFLLLARNLYATGRLYFLLFLQLNSESPPSNLPNICRQILPSIDLPRIQPSVVMARQARAIVWSARPAANSRPSA